MTSRFCTDKFILIKQLGQGAFGSVFLVYDNMLNSYTAVKIAKSFDTLGLEQEIAIISKLNELKIPNIPKFYGNGYCKLLDNKLYYEMDVQDENLQTFIDNGNELNKNQLYDMIFELLYTLAYFRKYNFKHRDISYIKSIHCRVNINYHRIKISL